MRASFLVGLLVLATGCNSSVVDEPGVIRIVSSLPRTGSAKTQTDTIVNGIKMAIEEANGKIGEFTIDYKDLDDATASAGQWTAELESANAEMAARDPNVMVYIGPYNSGAAKNSIPILNRAGLLMISPAVTGVGFTKPGLGKSDEPDIYRESGKLNFTRVVPADDLQGKLGAEWAAQSLGVKKVYVLDDTEVYGKGVATIFRQHCVNVGIEVVGSESIDPKQAEYSGLMLKIKATNPDMIYLGATSQSNAGQVAKDMVANGLADTCKLMVPDGCYENAFIQAAGANTFNKLKAYVTFGGMPPKEMQGKGKAFVENYKKKFGTEPEGYSVYGYEAAQVALEAIRKAGKKDRNAVREACLAIKDFEGALGTWSFDANGDTTSSVMSGSTVADGDFKFVKVLGQK